ncbi:MAG: hypothetical protein EA361_12115 [Bacteroidetes bacterium]|nr:MAG: hypothetical protein EA361_12115 [Bacteroidota bacterium]
MHKSFPWLYTLFFICFSIFCLTATPVYTNTHLHYAFRSDTIITDTIIRPFENLIQDTIPIDTIPLDTLPSAPDTAEPERPARRVTHPPIREKEKIDTLPATMVPWYTEEQLQNPFALRPQYADTTLLNHHHYDFATQEGLLFAQKGNIGHVHRRLYFSPDLSPGLKLNEYKLYGGYLFRHEDLRFYRPKHVFSELFYVIGDDREQLFSGKHNQKLHENLHMGFQYKIVNSPGAFTRIGARNSSFYFSGDYLSTNQRYQALASVIVNRVRNHESGGLEDHQAFELDDRSTFVNLERAESTFRDFSVNLRHFYQTGFYIASDTGDQTRFINLGRINHDFSYKRTAFLYNDNNPLYPHYDFPRIDSVITIDSTAIHRVENLISWSNFPLTSGRGTFPFNFKLYLKHSSYTIEQPDFIPEGADTLNEDNERIYYATKNSYNEWVQGIELQSDQRRFLSFGGHASITLGGYHDEDIHAGGFLNIGGAESRYNLSNRLTYALTEAPFFYNKLSVNNIRWENDFDKIQIINLSSRLTTPFITLEGNYYLLDRMVYLNEEALPVQNTTELGYFTLGAFSDLQFGWLGLRNHVVLQQGSSENFENYPSLVSYHSIYAHFGLSDRAMINKVGFDFYYNTGYNAMAWSPVARAFHLQNDHLMQDKFLVDVFWNAKVSNARLFLKYQNLLGLIPDIRHHYDIPFYPIPQSMFKFGVSWMFFN